MPHQINKGLLPLTRDKRDFSFHRTFGAVAPIDLPEEFIVAAPLAIQDQGVTDLCTAEASSAVAEDQSGLLFSPEWFFAKEKQILGNYQSYGADLRTACKAAVKFGFLPQNSAPYSLENQTRDFIANWLNWPSNLDALAAKYKRSNFFAVEQFAGDLFDSIRSTLFTNAQKKNSVLAGSNWYGEWNNCAGGVIPKVYGSPVAQHAYKIFGWKMIAGEPYLIIQNSEGKQSGDNGLLYMPREVANKELTFGLFCFAEADPSIVETVKYPFWIIILDFLIHLFKTYATS